MKHIAILSAIRDLEYVNYVEEISWGKNNGK